MSTTGHDNEAINVKGLKASLKLGGNKGIYNEAVCSTAGNTAAKVTDTTPPSFSLVKGAKIIVKFTNAITVANATLKVGSSAAKNINYKGVRLPANLVKAETSLLLQYDGTAWNILGDLNIDSPEKLGFGFGTCSTDAATEEKTVAVNDFILLKNGIVSVYFTMSNTAVNATLNVNSTGAKPIRINGTPVQPGFIKARTVVQFQYDGTAWNIVGMTGMEPGSTDSDLYVDMGLPSGLLWAKANIDVTTESGFAEVDGKPSPFKYECSFFSWGNVDGHNPTANNSFSPYTWGSGNEVEPYVSSEGHKLTGNIGPSYDAVRKKLGAPWRMPTTEEFAELFANIDYVQADGETVIDASQTNKLVTVNDVVGIYLKSKINGNLLFFPCSGNGGNASWNGRGSYGRYWSASFFSAAGARYLYFGSGGVTPQSHDYRFFGFAVRPVQ